MGSAPAFQDATRHGETPFSSFAAAPPSAEPVSPILGSPVEPPFGSAPPGSPFRTSPLDSRPVESRSYADPFAQTAHPGPGHAAPPRFGAEPRMSADAAHQALDALAQGLAASAAASSISPEAASPAIPLTPVFEAPEPDLRPHATAPSMLPVAVSSPGSIPVTRTLEDAVADMLRPMLQQWVAENMPRIIERALRTEVAQSVKPGNKPPGT